MFSSMNEKKKTMISWIIYIISIVLFLVQLIISLSPFNGSDNELNAVGIAMVIIGIINLVLLVIGFILFVKNVNTEKGNAVKIAGITLRIIVLIFTLLLTAIWLMGFLFS